MNKIAILAVAAALFAAGCASEDPSLGAGSSYVGTLVFANDLPKFSDTVQTTAANAVSSESGRTYAVQTNATGHVVVNVPWTEGGGMQPGDLYLGYDEDDGEYHLYTR